MTHEREQSHATTTSGTSPDREDLEPGRASKSALMRKPDHAIASGLVQRAARDANGVAEGADAAVAAASSSSGSALPATLMRKFESSLGADLGGVRVHTGAASAAANDAVGAKAYTLGNDIHFGAGQYDPSSPAGEHLLAHEVAHTVQQSGGAQRMQFKLAVSSPGDALEHEADHAADAMVSGAPVTVGAATGAQRNVYREAKGSDDTQSATVFKQGLGLGDWIGAVNSLVTGGYAIYEGVKKIREDAYFFQKEKLEIAKSLESIASSVLKTAKGISTVLHAAQDLKDPVEGASKLLAAATLFTDACRTVSAFSSMAELDSFLADPTDKAKAAAWGKKVGKTFDTVGDLVGGITGALLPGFVGDYFRGLFSAPANYIAYFQAIMDTYYAKVDEEAGMSDVNIKAVQAPYVKGGTFAGTLALMFAGAPDGLQRIMGANYETLELKNVGFAAGKAKVLALVSQQSNEQDVFDWTRYVKSWTSPTSHS